LNTSCFAISLIPIFLRAPHRRSISTILSAVLEYFQGTKNLYRRLRRRSTADSFEDPLSPSQTRLLGDDGFPGEPFSNPSPLPDPDGPLSVRETAKLSLEFSLLWFGANYLVAACLEYTSVASSTILTSTSSIWTLIFGALMRVEQFSFKKLIGVLASLAGIVLISSVDLSGKDNDKNRGNFPHKSQGQIAIGDAMAFGSAVMYGIYAVVMKKRIGNEDRVSMPLFFGLVGLFNVILLWPGFFVLHFTGVEKFEFPPTGKVWTVVMVSDTGPLPWQVPADF
jgi:solute carrier family 35 protein F5